MESNTEAMNRISLDENLPHDSCEETSSGTRTDDDHQCGSLSPEPSDDASNAISAGVEYSGRVSRTDASTQTTEYLTVPHTEKSSFKTGASNVPRVDDDCSYVWQFLDSRGFWIDYGNVRSIGARDGGVHQRSDQIENEFRRGHKCYFVESKYNQYEVNFEQMIQMNTHSQRTRPVRRIQKNREVKSDGSQPWELLPSYWTDMGTQAGCGPSILIPMSQNSSESLHFTRQVNFFLPRSVIREFYRIQAPHLYRCYQIRKASLERLYPAVRYSEEYMYHGTQRCNVHNISQENIDWRRHGTANGEQEGCGAYFTNYFTAAAVYGIQRRESSQNRLAFSANVTQGAGAMPPSAMPPSAMPPSAMPPSAMPPSAMPPSAMPPSAMPPSAMPPFVMTPSVRPLYVMTPFVRPLYVMPPSVRPPFVTPPSVNSSLYQQALLVNAAQQNLVINGNQTSSMVPRIYNPLQSAVGFAPRPQNIGGFLNLECSIGEKEITIIIAKVLTGRIRLGERGIIIPGDDVDGVPFDTTVNNLINPSVFVKYHVEEYYPEYCIVLDN